MQKAILELSHMGVMPTVRGATEEQVTAFERVIHSLVGPFSDAELVIALRTFHHDEAEDLFGIAWTLLHKLETGDLAQLKRALEDIPDGGWISKIKQRIALSEKPS